MEGAKELSELSKLYADDEGRASCPCKNCLNAKGQLTDIIFYYIAQFGFDQSYDVWVNYGKQLLDFGDIEESDEVDSVGKKDNDDVDELLCYAFPTEYDEERNNADNGVNRSARHNVDADINRSHYSRM